MHAPFAHATAARAVCQPRYAELDPGFVDAVVLATRGRLRETEVARLDQRRLRLVRPARRDALALLRAPKRLTGAGPVVRIEVMLHRIAHVLLVAALASSSVSAPFQHVHAHGPAYGASSSHGEATDEHCAHHHAEGAHWHLAEGRTSGADGARAAAGAGHRHAAVALPSIAVETSPICVDVSAAPVELPDAAALPNPPGVPAPVDANAGPDPPPRAASAARAPPARF